MAAVKAGHPPGHQRRGGGQGVFSGVSRVAETASLPGDPDNSSRDDRVFPDGSMHISLVVDFSAVSAALIRLPASEAEGQRSPDTEAQLLTRC